MKVTDHPEDGTSVTMETAAPFLEMAEMLKQQLPESEVEQSADHILERIYMVTVAALVTGKIASVSVKPRIVDGVVDGFEVKTSADDGAIDEMFAMNPEEAFAKLAGHFVKVAVKKRARPDISDFLNGLLGAIGKELEDDEDEEGEDAPEPTPAPASEPAESSDKAA